MVLRFAAGLLRGPQRADGRGNRPSVMGEPLLVPMLVVLAVVWLLPHNPYPTRLTSAITSQLLSYTPTIPSVHIDTHPSTTFQSRYPANKTALYIEPRADVPFMIPLLLHMMLVVPPDWRFVFFGSTATVQKVRDSYTAAMYEGLGKLHVRDLSETSWGAEWGREGWEDGEGTLGTEEIQSRLLTNRTFYEKELRGAEWLLVWHSDAILCANAEVGLDEWLGWDWVGAPWSDGRRYGGNGGLSIRRVSKVLEILEFQKRLDNSFPEDLWMSSRLETIPNAKMCPPEKAKEFAVADIWHDNPLGYHVNPGALAQGVWKPIDRRRKIYEYCPDVKIILDMALDREKCPEQTEAENQESQMWREAEELRKSEEGKSYEEQQEEIKKMAEEHTKAVEKQKQDEIIKKKQKEKEAYEAAIAKHKSQKEAAEAKKAAGFGEAGVLKPGLPGLDDKDEKERLGLEFGPGHDEGENKGSSHPNHDDGKSQDSGSSQHKDAKVQGSENSKHDAGNSHGPGSSKHDGVKNEDLGSSRHEDTIETSTGEKFDDDRQREGSGEPKIPELNDFEHLEASTDTLEGATDELGKAGVAGDVDDGVKDDSKVLDKPVLSKPGTDQEVPKNTADKSSDGPAMDIDFGADLDSNDGMDFVSNGVDHQSGGAAFDAD